MMSSRLLLRAIVTAIAGSAASPIEHFAVLFMENRAFDHIFGCATELLPGIDGITGNGTQWLDPNNHSKGEKVVSCGTAQYICKQGPTQSFQDAVKQIFGPGVDGSKGPYPQPRMDWFLNNTGEVSIEAFAPEQLPVKMALAQEFAVFNRFYSAIPGPSQPNHMFAQSATSCGVTDTGINYRQCGGWLPLFPQRTIYDSLLDAGKDFAIYVNGTLFDGGVPGDIYMWGLLKHIIGRAHSFTESDTGFFAAAAAGTLPALSWIIPRNFGDHPNDDHPCHDMALGEQLLKDVYEALRAGPLWPKTALLVVYDDPGGFADHMPTPTTAPPPAAPCNKKSAPDKFAFDRLGVRLANLLISPAVKKGTVFQDPEGLAGTAVRPANDSKFELSSIPATLKNLFGLPQFLTRRDAWAGSFHGVFNLTAPRTDCPTHLPEPPPPTVGVPAVHGCGDPSRVTRRQSRHLTLVATLLEQQCPNPKGMTRSGADAWLAEHLPQLMAKLEAGELAHLAEEVDRQPEESVEARVV